MDKSMLKTQFLLREISFTDEQIDSLLLLMKNTLETNQRFNLTAITDESEFLEKMILDSALGCVGNDFDGKEVLDFGTGAGFPGLVLYILNPTMNMTLMDSNSKKIRYLNDLCEANNYAINCVTARGEEFAKDNRNLYDFVIARAVAPLNILIEILVPMLKIGGFLVAMKGLNYEQEINESEVALKKLGCTIGRVYEDALPSNGDKRAIIYIQKNKETPKKYPRNYSEIKKKPL